MIPSNVRVPFMYIEIDPSRAMPRSPGMPLKVLLIGQKIAAGVMAAERKVRLRSVSEAELYFGAGSPLHLMADAFFKITQTVEVWAIALADPVGAAAATATHTLNMSEITAAGEYTLYVGGRRYAVSVNAKGSNVAIGDGLVAQINADKFCQVTAVHTTKEITVGVALSTGFTVGQYAKGMTSGCRISIANVGTSPHSVGGTVISGNSFVMGETISEFTDEACTIAGDASTTVTGQAGRSVVTLTTKALGGITSDIPIARNINPSETTPPGISTTFPEFGYFPAGSGGRPAIQPSLDLIGNDWFQIIAGQANRADSMAIVNSTLSAMYEFDQMRDAVYFCGVPGELSALSTFGEGRNSKHICAFHARRMPTISYVLAATVAAAFAKEVSADPNSNLQNIALPNIVPPHPDSRFTWAENNSLLFSGISTWYVDAGGTVRVQLAITTRRKNEAGADTIDFLNVETMFNLMALRYEFRNTFMTKYPRARLADDGVEVNAGIQVLTPKIAKAEAVSIFRDWQARGLVENIEQFKRDLSVVRNSQDPNRLDFVVSPDLMNHFRIGCVSLQFLLSS